MDSISFAQEVIAGDGWLIVDAQGNLKIAPLDYVPQDGDVILSVGENPLTVPEDIVTELRVSIAQQGSVQSVDAQSGIQGVLDSLEQGGDPTAEDGNDPQSGDDDGSSLTATGAVERDGAQTIATTDFQTEGVFPAGFTPEQSDTVTNLIVQTVSLLEALVPSTVSLTDNNGEEVINGEGETGVISGFIGEEGESLDSLVITDINGDQITIDVSDVKLVDGRYEVTDIDVSELADGELTVIAGSTDVDGNTIEVTDTVEKDFTYGDDGDDDGADTTPPTVALTDNNGEEVINGEGETATITGFIGEGGDSLDSLIITDIENNQIVIDVSGVSVVDGNYEVTGIDVEGLVDGELTVTAGSTDIDGNTIEVTDTAEKDFTYGDDGDDEGDDTTPPYVSMTDNTAGEDSAENEVINESEQATITGYLGEGGKTLDSLVITGPGGEPIDIPLNLVTVDEDGYYKVENVDVSGFDDGILTVTAQSTDVDGNKASVTDTVEKDFTYGDDGDDEGDETTPPFVSMTDNTAGEDSAENEVINESEQATITGYLGEGGKTLDSLVITGPGGEPIDIPLNLVTVDEDGYYNVENVDVSGFDDGILTVTAQSTDVDGNKASVTDTVEKDFTYGDDGDDEGDDTTPPYVSMTDNTAGEDSAENEVINESEQATITGYLGEGGKTLDSLVITGPGGEPIDIPLNLVTVDEDGYYNVENVDVSGFDDGILTVTAQSTDVDGNKASVTDTVEKDFTYGDDGDDEGDDTTPPYVSMTDNTAGEDSAENEVINESEQATITGYLGEGGTTLDSLVITGPGGEPIDIPLNLVTVDENGYYNVENVDVSGFDDGILTVTAQSTDVDGNKASVTDTVEKDFTYGDDGDDEGDDTTPPYVSMTDNTAGEDSAENEVINESEQATITGYLGEGGKTLDSLVITGPGGEPIDIPLNLVTVDEDGYYKVENVDVSGFDDGILTVTAQSTDVDGNKASVTDTVEKDFTYGDDGDDEGDDTTPPYVSMTDNTAGEDAAENEVINESEQATITGYLGEGGKTLDSLVITGPGGEPIDIPLNLVTVDEDGYYKVENVDVSGFDDGILTVTAQSTDVDGNKASVTDTVEKDFTYGDDGDDEGDDTTPPYVSMTDNTAGEDSAENEVINESEQATITGYLGEGGKTLDSLVITGPGGDPIDIPLNLVTVDENGYYNVENVDVSGFDDGILTVTAQSTDVDGNKASVTDTVEKDFTYGDDGDDEGDDTTPPYVSMTDNTAGEDSAENEVINESEQATITGYLGEGGKTLDSLVITGPGGEPIDIPLNLVTVDEDGYYNVENVDVSGFDDGILTVTAQSTDVDGNKASVTDTVEKDFTYGDDGDDEGDETTPPFVSMTDNTAGEDSAENEVINESEQATITGYLGEGGKTLDSLVITGPGGEPIDIPLNLVTVDEDGYYKVENVDVSGFDDGILTVTAQSTDVDGNKASVTDTVEKDFTYGDDGDDEGDDTTPPYVSMTDNTAGEDSAENEVINESEQATITGYLGEGGKTLDSLVITGPGGDPIDIPLNLVTVDENGYYNVENVDVSGFDDGILTVTAQSTDVDGNKASVTDTVEKDFTYGDDGDDEGDDTTPPYVSMTDNTAGEDSAENEVINESEQATITGYLGEGGKTLDSLVITGPGGEPIDIPLNLITVDEDGYYKVENVDVSGFDDGILTVTAQSTDVDGNKASVTDTVEKDFTYGDDGDDSGDIAQPTVSLTDNNPDETANNREIINGADLVDGELVGDPEKATIVGYLGEGGKTLDSLIISGAGSDPIVVDVSSVIVDDDGNYEVQDIDVSGFDDGVLTVTAKSTDVDGNKATVTDTVVKDFTYGDDDDNDDLITQPTVSLTDDIGEEEIDGTDTATITGYIGEGGLSLDSVVITDSEGETLTVELADITLVDGNYIITGVDVGHLSNGELTVTANSTDIDGNKASVTDDALKAEYTFVEEGSGDQEINGDDRNEIIIGDTTSVIGDKGEDLNIVILLDRSGSMRGDAQIGTAKTQIIQAFNKIVDSAVKDFSGNANIMLAGFAGGTSIAFTVNLGADDETRTINEIKADFATAVNDIEADGSTNYAKAFDVATEWLEDQGASESNPGVTLFITDGQPNRDEDEDEDAFDSLDDISNVVAIGLDLNDDGKTTLNTFDSDGAAEFIVDVDGLAEAIEGEIFETLPGKDTISSDGGRDILFGDTISFDGIEGQGVEALRNYVVANSDQTNETITTKDVFDYISANADEFNISADNHEGDTLEGGDQDDILYGQGGNDILDGSSGNDILFGGSGEDVMTGGTGADTFVWTSSDLIDSSGIQSGATNVDVIKDFTIGEDTIDLSDLFSGEDESVVLDELLDSVTGTDTASLVVEQGGKQVIIEFDGVSANDLMNSLDQIVVINDN